MFKKLRCTIPQNAERQMEIANTQFIQTVLEEDRRVKQLRAQEIQSTAENPRIKAQNESIDISTELKEYKKEQFLEKKRRQQLRENSQELRQLEIQLRAAYVSKALVEQKSEVDKAKDQQILDKRRDDKNFEQERIKCVELTRKQEEEERRKKEKFRNVLLEQMSQTQTKKMQEYEEILKDKLTMKETVKKIAAEQQQELKDLAARKERAKTEMQEFLHTQELIKSQERSLKVDENERFLEMMRQRDAEKKRREDQKREAIERSQAQSEKIGKQLYVIESEKQKRENLLLDLLVEERKANDDFRFRRALEKEIEQRIQMRTELERYQKEIVRQNKEREMDEENKMRMEHMRILAERDKIEQLSNEKRRRKIMEHGRAIQEMIEENRRRRAIEAAEVLQDYEMQIKEQQKRDQLIEEERIRLLKTQPPEVLRFLPAGVIRESDREFLPLPPNKDKQ